MGRLVIYTCITGAYDILVDPVVIFPGVDFVCFTDHDVKRKVWQLRNPVHREKNALLTARWHKLHPHELFPDYDYSLWVDGNVIPASASLMEILQGKMDGGVLWSGIRHPQRDDVYDEAFRIYSNGRESFFRLARICRFLESQGFPRHGGLMETNVILRAHNDPKVVATDRLWWTLLSEYTARDQMTHQYCMWKNGMPQDLLLGGEASARNCREFRYVVHDAPYRKSFPRDAWNAVKRLCFRIFLRMNGTPAT